MKTLNSSSTTSTTPSTPPSSRFSDYDRRYPNNNNSEPKKKNNKSMDNTNIRVQVRRPSMNSTTIFHPRDTAIDRREAQHPHRQQQQRSRSAFAGRERHSRRTNNSHDRPRSESRGNSHRHRGPRPSSPSRRDPPARKNTSRPSRHTGRSDRRRASSSAPDDKGGRRSHKRDSSKRSSNRHHQRRGVSTPSRRYDTRDANFNISSRSERNLTTTTSRRERNETRDRLSTSERAVSRGSGCGGAGNHNPNKPTTMSSREAEKQRILRWSAEFHAKRNVKKEREEADNKRLLSSSAIIMPPPPCVVRESRRDDDDGYCGRRDRSNSKSRRGREEDHVERRHSRSGERPTTSRSASTQRRREGWHRSNSSVVPGRPTSRSTPPTTRKSSREDRHDNYSNKNNSNNHSGHRRSASHHHNEGSLTLSELLSIPNQSSSDLNKSSSHDGLVRSDSNNLLVKSESNRNNIIKPRSPPKPLPPERKKEAIQEAIRRASVELLSSQICSLTIEVDNVKKNTAAGSSDVPKDATVHQEEEAASIRVDKSSAASTSSVGIPVSNNTQAQHRFDWKHLGGSLRSLKSHEDKSSHHEDLSKALSDSNNKTSPSLSSSSRPLSKIKDIVLRRGSSSFSSVPSKSLDDIHVLTRLDSDNSNIGERRCVLYRKENEGQAAASEDGAISSRGRSISMDAVNSADECALVLKNDSSRELTMLGSKELVRRGSGTLVKRGSTELVKKPDSGVVKRWASESFGDTVGLGSMDDHLSNDSIDIFRDVASLGTIGIGSMAYGLESTCHGCTNESKQETEFNESIDVVEKSNSSKKNEDSIIDLQVKTKPLKHRVSSLEDSGSIATMVNDISFRDLADHLRSPEKQSINIDSESCSMFPDTPKKGKDTKRIDEIMKQILKVKQKKKSSKSKKKPGTEKVTSSPPKNKTAAKQPPKKFPPPPPRRATHASDSKSNKLPSQPPPPARPIQAEAKPPSYHTPPLTSALRKHASTGDAPQNFTSTPITTPPLTSVLRKRASTGDAPQNFTSTPITPKTSKKDPLQHIMSQLEQLEHPPAPANNNDTRPVAARDQFGQTPQSSLTRRNTTPAKHDLGMSDHQTSEVIDMPYKDRKRGDGVYTGEVDQWGRPHGKGRSDYESGDFFEGRWVNGEPLLEDQQAYPHGPGVMNYLHPQPQMYGGMMPPSYVPFNSSMGSMNFNPMNNAAVFNGSMDSMNFNPMNSMNSFNNSMNFNPMNYQGP